MTRAIEWGSAMLTSPGQEVCGDRCVVTDVPGGTLIAVVDGLGHGSQAAAAAERAVAIIDRYGQEESLPRLVQRCDEALRETRGAVMSLAAFHAHEVMLSWLGIGNVTGVLFRSWPPAAYEQQPLWARAGVVGRQPARLRTSATSIRRGDLLVVATDGVAPHFADQLDVGGSVTEIAQHILERYGKETDDALALVVRYLG